jgi:hypothetical protein
MKPEALEPILKLLVVVMFAFVLTLFAAEIWFQSDSQLFQVIANILSGVTGAFLARIKPGKSGNTDVSSSGSDATVVVKEAQ